MKIIAIDKKLTIAVNKTIFTNKITNKRNIGTNKKLNILINKTIDISKINHKINHISI